MKMAGNKLGFFLAWIMNMIFRYEWFILFIILLVLHFLLKLPLWLCFLPIIMWVVHGLAVTLFFWGLSSFQGESTFNKPKKNVNPYSVGNSENRRKTENENENASSVINCAEEQV